jgi:hypothetical protein
MADTQQWTRSRASGQYIAVADEPKHLTAFVRRSHLGWHWRVEDFTGRLVDAGDEPMVEAAKAKAEKLLGGATRPLDSHKTGGTCT